MNKTILVERTMFCRRTVTIIHTRVEVVPDGPPIIIEHVELRHEPRWPQRRGQKEETHE